MRSRPTHNRHCGAAAPPKQSGAGAGRNRPTGLLRFARNDGATTRGSLHSLLAAAFALFALLVPIAAGAVEPDEILADPALEERARDISKDLRCVVCQNQSIDDSNAGIARDLRILVRERLVAGDSDEQVVDYVVARYGDYVLLDPPFKQETWALWIGPPLMAAIVATLVVLYIRAWQRRRYAEDDVDTLSPTDRAALDALVERIAANSPPPPPRSALRAEFEDPRPQPEITPETPGDAPDVTAPGASPDDDGASDLADPAGPKPA